MVANPAAPNSGEAVQLTATVEKYLEAIYHLANEGKPVIGGRLAERLAVSPPTVTGMSKRMTDLKLLALNEHKEAVLTAYGETMALLIARRHYISYASWSTCSAWRGTAPTSRPTVWSTPSHRRSSAGSAPCSATRRPAHTAARYPAAACRASRVASRLIVPLSTRPSSSSVSPSKVRMTSDCWSSSGGTVSNPAPGSSSPRSRPIAAP